MFVGVSLPFLLAAQQKNSVSITKRVLRIPEVTVVGKRPMKDIGVQRTRFDSIAMKENIALSMADVLTFNSSVFVKNYGRATLSTVAFRGTSPSHTQVTWNGMRINNPMLGMTDFSTIPSYFIDDASLLHGTSSVNETGGGLGGLVRLSTSPANHEGFGLQYVQGVGSFSTFDEFLRLTYGNKHWQSSTRVVYSSSPNDYKYRNRDKKENIYDEDKNIIGSYYPTERNRSGAYKDLHILQEIYYNTGAECFKKKIGADSWDLIELTGNFRSSQHICNATSWFSATLQGQSANEAMGDYKDESQKPILLLTNGNTEKEVIDFFLKKCRSMEIEIKSYPCLCGAELPPSTDFQS